MMFPVCFFQWDFTMMGGMLFVFVIVLFCMGFLCLIIQSRVGARLQALDYDILPPAIALTGYIIGPLILSANGQFFIGAHMAVRL